LGLSYIFLKLLFVPTPITGPAPRYRTVCVQLPVCATPSLRRHTVPPAHHRKKREAYRGSEFAPRILADSRLPVIMKVRVPFDFPISHTPPIVGPPRAELALPHV
jgi:hypothetical protein